ncbi:MAG: hypothetical protein AB7O62_10695 [Pirellulales bacterium]
MTSTATKTQAACERVAARLVQVHKQALMDVRKALNPTRATSKPAIAGHPLHSRPLPVATSAGAGRPGVGRVKKWLRQDYSDLGAH